MSTAWDKWNQENAMHPVGQQADLHTKKKGSSKTAKSTPMRNEITALQEQQAASMLRECEFRALLSECREFIQATDMHAHGFARRAELLAKLEAV